MQPTVVAGLDHVNASYLTPYGLIKSSWKKQAGQFEWHITVPPNSKAIVYLPAKNSAGIKESGKSLPATIKYAGQDKGQAMVEIGSGDYDFEVNN